MWQVNDTYPRPGARPTKNISIEFEILPKFAMLWYKMYSTDHNEIPLVRRVSDLTKNSFRKGLQIWIILLDIWLYF